MQGYSYQNGSSTNYWVASRCINLDKKFCHFNIYSITSGYLYSYCMFISNGFNYGSSHELCPVVSLSSKVLQEAEDGTYNVK